MKITLTLEAPPNDEEARFVWMAEVDVADEDEAYVKGREFRRLTIMLSNGYNAEAIEQGADET